MARARVGLADARRLWEFALGARAHLDWLIETYGIDCDLRLGYLHADHRERYTAETRQHVEHLRSAYGYEHIRFVERDELGPWSPPAAIAAAVSTRAPATCTR